MFKFNIGKSIKESVGLDIGSYAVKVAAITKEAENNILTAYNIKEIPNKGSNFKLEKVVAEALLEIDLHPEEVNLSLSGPNVVVRFIDLPRMTKDQLKGALTYEAEKYIPFNVNEVVTDSIILGDAKESGQMNVLLAAAKKDLIESQVSLIEKIGMSVNILDVDAFAVFNAFLSATKPEDKGTAFLNLGHSQTNVLIAIGSKPCFMRQIQIGSGEIARVREENQKHRAHTEVETSQEASLEAAAPQEANPHNTETEALNTVLKELTNEINLSLSYFENRYNSGISNIFCSGGMVYAEGVVDYLREKMGIPIQIWDPLNKIVIAENLSKGDLDKVSSQLAVSIGLALRE